MKHSESFGRGQDRKPTVTVVKSPPTGRLPEFHIVLCLCHGMVVQVSAPIMGKEKFLYLGV